MLVGPYYATGDQWRNNSWKNEEMEPKQKQHPIVDVAGDGSKVWCCKEQYYIGTWNVRFMNQGKLEVVKQEMARVNVNVLGVRELKWTGMGTFNSDDHYIYNWGQESLRRKGIATIDNKRVRNAVLGHNLGNDRMISVHFQGKPFRITVIQVYDPTSNAENWTWMVLWRPTRLSRINTQKRCRFHFKGREYKSRKSRNTWLLLLLLLSRFSRVRLCATPQMAAHQAPPSLGFSRQEHRSGLPFPSPIHESERWKWSRSVVSDS